MSQKVVKTIKNNILGSLKKDLTFNLSIDKLKK